MLIKKPKPVVAYKIFEASSLKVLAAQVNKAREEFIAKYNEKPAAGGRRWFAHFELIGGPRAVPVSSVKGGVRREQIECLFFQGAFQTAYVSDVRRRKLSRVVMRKNRAKRQASKKKAVKVKATAR